MFEVSDNLGGAGWDEKPVGEEARVARGVSTRRIGVLVSGGLDSGILVAHLLAEGHWVQPMYVRCQMSWQAGEEQALRRFLQALQGPRLSPLVVFEMPVGDLYGDHWSVTGHNVPDQATSDEAVFLPGRNALLVIKPALWCQLQGIDRLALAPLAHNPFEDATEAFFATLQETLNRSGRRCVRLDIPFAHLSKVEVLRLAARLPRPLPLELTFSCLAPRDGLHCGTCNKCAERRRAFRLAAMPDKTKYAETLPAGSG